jgi:glycerol-3-phosphate dehydrogenase
MLANNNGGQSARPQTVNPECARKALADLSSFVNERWKGMECVAWGDTLSEMQFMSWLYQGVCGLGEDSESKAFNN